MGDSSSYTESPHDSTDDVVKLNKDLEKMTEEADNLSVQLSWMAYDMVALRTSPELRASMRKLEDSYQRCRAAVCGDSDRKPDKDLEPVAATVLEI